MPDKKSYCESGKCTATCLEELKSCSGYEQTYFDFMKGCAYCGRSGKCLKPEAKNAN